MAILSIGFLVWGGSSADGSRRIVAIIHRRESMERLAASREDLRGGVIVGEEPGGGKWATELETKPLWDVGVITRGWVGERALRGLVGRAAVGRMVGAWVTLPRRGEGVGVSGGLSISREGRVSREV